MNARLFRILVAVAAVVGVGAGTGGFAAVQNAGNPNGRVLGATGVAQATFVTYNVTYSSTGLPSHSNPPSASWQVDLRDIADGHLVRTLLSGSSTAGAVAATRMSDGDVLLAQGVTGSCTTRLVRIDPVSAHSTGLRVLNTVIEQLAISPDDTSIAYLTWSPSTSPCVRWPGLEQDGPNLLAITNLRTGATRTTRALWRASWNPDGTRLIGGDAANGLAIIDPSDTGRIIRRLKPPADCHYNDEAVWTTAGIFTDETCGLHAITTAPPGTSAINNVVQLDDHGATQHTWRLPDCTGVRTLVTDASRQQVLLHLSSGFGNVGPCSVEHQHGNEIAVIDGARLRSVLSPNTYTTTVAAG